MPGFGVTPPPLTQARVSVLEQSPGAVQQQQRVLDARDRGHHPLEQQVRGVPGPCPPPCSPPRHPQTHPPVQVALRQEQAAQEPRRHPSSI